MPELLPEASANGVMPDYTGKLLAVFEAEAQQNQRNADQSHLHASQASLDPLSERELEVLHLIAQLNADVIAYVHPVVCRPGGMDFPALGSPT